MRSWYCEGETQMKYLGFQYPIYQSLLFFLSSAISCRKGRLLRRMRAFIQNSCAPNPARLHITPDSLVHLHVIRESLEKIDCEINTMSRGRAACRQFLVYLTEILVVYEIQSFFPEYFDANLPAWFRSLIMVKQRYDATEVTRRIESNAQRRLKEMQNMHARLGKFSQITINAKHSLNFFLVLQGNTSNTSHKPYTVTTESYKQQKRHIASNACCFQQLSTNSMIWKPRKS